MASYATFYALWTFPQLGYPSTARVNTRFFCVPMSTVGGAVKLPSDLPASITHLVRTDATPALSGGDWVPWCTLAQLGTTACNALKKAARCKPLVDPCCDAKGSTAISRSGHRRGKHWCSARLLKPPGVGAKERRAMLRLSCGCTEEPPLHYHRTRFCSSY